MYICPLFFRDLIVSNIRCLIFRLPAKCDGCTAASDLSSSPPDADPPGFQFPRSSF